MTIWSPWASQSHRQHWIQDLSCPSPWVQTLRISFVSEYYKSLILWLKIFVTMMQGGTFSNSTVWIDIERDFGRHRGILLPEPGLQQTIIRIFQSVFFIDIYVKKINCQIRSYHEEAVKKCWMQCSAQRVGFFNIGSGRVGYRKKYRVAGRVRVG